MDSSIPPGFEVESMPSGAAAAPSIPPGFEIESTPSAALPAPAIPHGFEIESMPSAPSLSIPDGFEVESTPSAGGAPQWMHSLARGAGDVAMAGAAFQSTYGQMGGPNALATAAQVQGLATGRQQMREALPADDTVVNNVATGVGATLPTIPAMVMGGPAGAAGAGFIVNTGNSLLDTEDRVQRGEQISDARRQQMALGSGAVGAATEFVGGKLTMGVLPKVVNAVGGGALRRAATATAGNILSQGAINSAQQVGQNAVTAAGVTQNKPALTEGALTAFETGAGVGLVHAPLTYHAALRNERAMETPAPASHEIPPGFEIESMPKPTGAEIPPGFEIESLPPDPFAGETPKGDLTGLVAPAGTTEAGTTPQEQTPAQAGPPQATPQPPPADSALPAEQDATTVKGDVVQQRSGDTGDAPQAQPEGGQPAELATEMAAGEGRPEAESADAGTPPRDVPAADGELPPAQPEEQPVAKPAQPAQGEGQQTGDELGEGAPPAAHTENVAEPTPQIEPPPATGVLDHVESWAREQLRKIDVNTAEALDKLTPEQRRQRGSAGSLDPQRLILHAVIGATKIARGVKRYADWSLEMAKDLGDRFTGLSVPARGQVWREARRVAALDDKSRAEYIAQRATVKASETPGQTTRRLTGQVKDVGKAVSEVQALRAKFDAMAKGSREGFTAGHQQAIGELEGMKKALVDTIRATLPPELHGRFLGDVAKVRTFGQMRLALGKASNLLADHELRQAVGGIEKLVTKRRLELPKPKAIRTPELTEAEAAQRAGERMVKGLKDKQTGDNLREVDLTQLPEPQREQVKKLIAAAAAFRARAKEILATPASASVEEKALAVDNIEKTEREIRQHVADALNTQEIKVGERLVKRDDLVRQFVKSVDPEGKAASEKVEGTAAPDRGTATQALLRLHASPETLIGNMAGRDSDVYKTLIEHVRESQEAFDNEQMQYQKHISTAFHEAGIEPGTRTLDRWLNKRETLDLPDAGKFAMTRNEMTGLAASVADPETAALVDRGVKWSPRNNPRPEPITLTRRDIDAIVARLTPGEQKLIDAFKSYNEKNVTARSMAAKLDLSGYAPDAHEKYYPRARNMKAREDAGLPEGWIGMRRRALENISSMKERAPDLVTPLYLPEFLQDTSRYIDDVARLMHLAVPTRNAAALLEHPDVTQALAHRYGEGANKYFRRYLEDTMQVQVKPEGGKLSAAVARNVSRAWLQANPSPVMKNIVGGTVSLLPEFEAADLTPALAHMFSPGTYREMVNKSGTAWKRYEGGGLYGAYSPLTETRVEPAARLKFGEAVKSAKVGAAVDALPFMRWADSVPLRVAWEASKNFVNRTMPKASAEAKQAAQLRKFHDAIYRTQNGGSSTEISGLTSLAKRHPAWQPWLMFKSQALKNMNLLLQAKKLPAGQRAKIATAVTLNALASAGVGYGLKVGVSALGRAFGGTVPDPKDEERMKKNAGWGLLNDVAGMAWGGDIAASLVRATATGRPSQVEISSPVLESVKNLLVSLVDLAVRSSKAAGSAEGPEADKAWTALIKSGEKTILAGSTIGGLPIEPLARLVARGVAAGQYQPTDPRVLKHRAEVKEKTQHSKQVRNSVPGLDALLRERTDLITKGGSELERLSDKEYDRKRELDDAFGIYEDLRDEKITLDEARRYVGQVSRPAARAPTR